MGKTTCSDAGFVVDNDCDAFPDDPSDLECSMAPSPQISLILQDAAHEVLMWVGFGTLVGLAAKAIMPGRDPGGALGTMLMGIVGSVMGCGVIAFFCHGYRIMPISLAGFAAGTLGSFIILFFYRLLAGTFFVESEDGDRILFRSERARRRRLLRQG
jgi:uncharacterized membrane protein YeaQ/YmgE (transglycosylase-associated protein family)